MFRKSYSRRTEALKILKAYLQILANAKEPTEISHHTYQHIARAYRILSDYGPNTQVYKSELGKIEFIVDRPSDTDKNDKVTLHTLIEELLDIDYPKLTKERIKSSTRKIGLEFKTPRIGTIFLNGRNAEGFGLLIKNIDNVIEYYNMLNDASKNE